VSALLTDVKTASARTFVLSTLNNRPEGVRFSEFFLSSNLSATPSELKQVLFKLELEGVIEEPVPTLYRLARKKEPLPEPAPPRTFSCQFCGLTYFDEKLWNRCENWCAVRGSPKDEIAIQSLEAKGKKAPEPQESPETE
jgi:hypothetical protein